MSQLFERRRAGVLCHITSLPANKNNDNSSTKQASDSVVADFQSGDLGQESRRFVDFLYDIGATVWQTLPLNMPHADGSPYQCLSAHAGNPEFISLDVLVGLGWLTTAELQTTTVDKQSVINKVFINFYQLAEQQSQQDFAQFCNEQAFWLDDFALFLALRERFHQSGWNAWPAEYKNRDALALKSAETLLAQEIGAIKFTQFLFFSQWLALKAYSASKGVYLFGDIPIFVSYDSADVWAMPHLFKLDADKNMTVVAGVPPDYFCATGQRWGNPHYNWEAMQADGFAWWLARMQTQNTLFDMVRIDHFRGLESAWEIPVTDETAMNGQWVQAPGHALLDAIQQHFPQMTLIAEDLGVITAEVNALREAFALPGMKILQFAFGGQDDNPYLPHNTETDSVVYTGTHDNDTTLGWYLSAGEHERENFKKYFSGYAPKSTFEMPFSMVQMALMSVSKLAIIPMQDIMELGTEHRMNTPGTNEGNWRWHFNWSQLSSKQKKKITVAISKNKRN